MKTLTDKQIASLLAQRARIDKQEKKYKQRIVRLFGHIDANKHSQNCPIAGVTIMGCSAITGVLPCACGGGK